MASADQQVARNREIRIASANGDDPKQIAARYNLSATRVRQILLEQTEELADIADSDPVRSALERRVQFQWAHEEAVALYERLPDSNPPRSAR
jgi:hypothetical protein